MATRKKGKVKTKAKTKPKTKARRNKRTLSKAARGKTVRKKIAKRPARRPTAKTAAKTARPKATAGKPRSTRPRASETAKAPPSRPATPIASEQRIGVVTHYYSHLSVVAMQLEPGATLRVGDVIHIWGHTTDFNQKVESLEVNHAPVTEVGARDDFGLKVIEHAREHDVVFKVRA